MRLQEKIVHVQEKEKPMQTMIYGLWQNEQQMHVQTGLMKLKTKTSKFDALKAQLDFRKKFWSKIPQTRVFFAFQKTKKKLSIEEVCSNLCELFPPTPGCDKEGLIGKRIKHCKWSVDGTNKWYIYLGMILDVVAGTD